MFTRRRPAASREGTSRPPRRGAWQILIGAIWETSGEVILGVLLALIGGTIGGQAGGVMIWTGVLLPLFKLLSSIVAEMRYTRLEDHIDTMVSEVSRTAHVLQVDALLVDIKSTLLKSYLDLKLKLLKEKVERSARKELTDCTLPELYEMIRHMSSQANELLSVDMVISRWTVILRPHDYVAAGLTSDEAERRDHENRRSRYLNETALLHSELCRRLEKPASGRIAIKRVFFLNEHVVGDRECIQVLRVMSELQDKVGVQHLETRVLDDDGPPEVIEACHGLGDVVIFDNSIAIKELVGGKAGHQVVLSDSAISVLKSRFEGVWEEATPVATYVKQHQTEAGAHGKADC